MLLPAENGRNLRQKMQLATRLNLSKPERPEEAGPGADTTALWFH
jgi:hypothetical protein